jgi:hypothetical protein
MDHEYQIVGASRFELVINLGIAKSLASPCHRRCSTRADEVIK